MLEKSLENHLCDDKRINDKRFVQKNDLTIKSKQGERKDPCNNKFGLRVFQNKALNPKAHKLNINKKNINNFK